MWEVAYLKPVYPPDWLQCCSDISPPPHFFCPCYAVGDYVDRGSFSVENVLALFLFKVLYPGSMFLQRGNHETKNMNKVPAEGRGGGGGSPSVAAH